MDYQRGKPGSKQGPTARKPPFQGPSGSTKHARKSCVFIKRAVDTPWFGTRRSVVRIHSPRPKFPYKSMICKSSFWRYARRKRTLPFSCMVVMRSRHAVRRAFVPKYSRASRLVGHFVAAKSRSHPTSSPVMRREVVLPHVCSGVPGLTPPWCDTATRKMFLDLSDGLARVASPGRSLGRLQSFRLTFTFRIFK